MKRLAREEVAAMWLYLAGHRHPIYRIRQYVKIEKERISQFLRELDAAKPKRRKS